MERRAESNARGDFTVSALPPGQYQLSILKPGFRKTVYSNLTLDVEQTLRIDAALELGEITTQIEVGGGPFLSETDSSGLGDGSAKDSGSAAQSAPIPDADPAGSRCHNAGLWFA